MKKTIWIYVTCLLTTSCASTPPRPLTSEDVAEVVENNASEIRDCYELALQKDSELQGRITMEWTVSSGGNARNIVVKKAEPTIKSEDLTNCMIKRIRLWNFPRPQDGQDAVVSFPFVLSMKKKSISDSESTED